MVILWLCSKKRTWTGGGWVSQTSHGPKREPKKAGPGPGALGWNAEEIYLRDIHKMWGLTGHAR